MRELIPLAEVRADKREAEGVQVIVNGIEAQMFVMNAGSRFWTDVSTWVGQRKILSPAESGVLDKAAAMQTRPLTEKQSEIALRALKKLQEEGCQLRLPEMVST